MQLFLSDAVFWNIAVNMQCTSEETQCSVMCCTLSVLMHLSCNGYVQQIAFGQPVGLLAT